MLEMDEIKNQLRQAIIELDDRLSPVITNSQAVEKNKQDDPDLVPLANKLWDTNNFLREQIAAINRLRHRVEL